MQEKNKSYEKNKFRIRRIRFYSAKVTSIYKSPHITHRTHGDSSQSPYPYHTHTHGNLHGNPHTHGSPVTHVACSDAVSSELPVVFVAKIGEITELFALFWQF